MQYKPWDSKARVRTMLLVSLAETPFLLAGALMLASGDRGLLLPAVALIVATAVIGSFFILRSVRLRQCPTCSGLLEARLEGPWCPACNVCYTNDPRKLPPRS